VANTYLIMHVLPVSRRIAGMVPRFELFRVPRTRATLRNLTNLHTLQRFPDSTVAAFP
jgi:hypothetical protein